MDIFLYQIIVYHIKKERKKKVDVIVDLLTSLPPLRMTKPQNERFYSFFSLLTQVFVLLNEKLNTSCISRI